MAHPTFNEMPLGLENAIMSSEIAALRAQLAQLQERAGRMEEFVKMCAESRDAGRHDGRPEECPAHSDVHMWLEARNLLTHPAEAGEGERT